MNVFASLPGIKLVHLDGLNMTYAHGCAATTSVLHAAAAHAAADGAPPVGPAATTAAAAATPAAASSPARPGMPSLCTQPRLLLWGFGTKRH